ncbi:hypothetical protein ACFRFJ_15830 [Streptomyces hydrogenans]|uniref:hypothetical protein n=1 Tax=Streptomyces hydrogenans TaxID=1873719 RepID=UPI00367E1248
MNNRAWTASRVVVSVAALITAGWSLYAVSRHYGAPILIAGASVAVFDGIAYGCQYLATVASTAGRSGFGARLAALFMVGVSVALNIKHAQLIDGGPTAALLFAVPSIGLLAIAELDWAGGRADARTARGEQPYRLPAYGGWAWLLAPRTAAQSVRTAALAHIQHTHTNDQPLLSGQSGPSPDTALTKTGTDAVREYFAMVNPIDAIHVAHNSQPALSSAELASLLVSYGVPVDQVQVDIVLGRRGPAGNVDRTGALPAPGPQPELVAAQSGPSGLAPDPLRVALAQLQDRFAAMDPGEVIRIIDKLQPALSSQRLADLLADYGLNVTRPAVDLALRRPQAELLAVLSGQSGPGPAAATATTAVEALIEYGVRDVDLAIPAVCAHLGPAVREDTVRRLFDRKVKPIREAETAQTTEAAEADSIGKGGGGYN